MSEATVWGRADFLHFAQRPKKVKSVDIPGEGRCFVRVMSGAERDAWEAGNYEWDEAAGRSRQTMPNARARLLVICLCNEQGERLFDEAGYAEVLGGADASVLDAIYDQAAEFNKLTRDSQKATEKNLPTAPNSSSGSASPAS